MNKILVISFTNLKSDPRVFRQIDFLKNQYTVSCCGLKSPEIESVKFFKVDKEQKKIKRLFTYFLLLFKFYNLFYWNQKNIKEGLRILKNEEFDLIIANDIDSLPFAEKLALNCGAKIIFDAHEYSPKEHENNWTWRILFQGYNIFLLRKYTKNISLMYTVCEGLANEYKKVFNLNVKVLTNASDYYEIEPFLNLEENKIKLIHHGGAMPNRKIETMIEMMNHLDKRFTLDLMLVKSKQKYYDFLVAKAEKMTNVNFLEPVQLNDIIPFTSKYDIGVYILEPNSFNNEYALPNKLFEFIQARLAIAIGPSPEMKKIVLQNEIGIVAEDFSAISLAKEINKITHSQIIDFKKKSNTIAHEINSTANMNMLLNDIQNVLSK